MASSEKTDMGIKSYDHTNHINTSSEKGASGEWRVGEIINIGLGRISA